MKTLPGWAERLLRSICPEELFEQIVGDIIEIYNHDVKTVGTRKAKWRFFITVLRFIRPGILLRTRFSPPTNIPDMFLTQLKFARRAFLKDKFFSVLNISGLSLGISVGIILLLILQNDLTYDQHFAQHERIHRLGAHYQIPGTDAYIGNSARELASILKEVYPEIETLVRIARLDRQLIKAAGHESEKTFYEENAVQADSTYFEVFEHAFVAGDKKTCLKEPSSVVITTSTAAKYFGTDNPLDRILLIENQPFTVTGVIRDLPENTHLKFDFLLAGLKELRPGWTTTMKDDKPISLVFWNPDVYTYLLLPEKYDAARFATRFKTIYNNYYKELSDQSDADFSPVLQPLAEIHFSGFDDSEPKGNRTYLLAFSGVGLMVVLLACINYMNLATAKATNRATEVAIKKIVGARRTNLFFSFLTESFLLSFISLAVGMVMVIFILHATSFSTLIGKNLTINILHNPVLLFGSLGIALLIGLASGLYPATILPLIPAVSALKGRYKNSASRHRFRKMLVTVQFIISICVITCTLYMRNQVDFLINRDLGFDKENILVVPIYGDSLRKNLQPLKNSLLQSQHIKAITASASTMGMNIGGNVMFGETETGMQQQGGILALFVDDDYLKTLGVTLIKGRDFRAGEGVDEDGVYIANEAAVKLMGWNDDALGKKVSFWGGANEGTVIGVVKDFNSASLHQTVSPMFIVKGHWDTGLLHMRLTGEHIPETIAFVQEHWSKYENTRPFEYFFLDHRFNEQYREDITQNKLLTVLSDICIFISLLGLIGLSAFSATQRTKEIGVRKILGAKVSQVIVLLSKDILLLVLISSVVALPLCWWVISAWLENFAYRGELNYLLYVIITMSAIGFVFLVILFQSLKTARANPVDSLRSE